MGGSQWGGYTEIQIKNILTDIFGKIYPLLSLHVNVTLHSNQDCQSQCLQYSATILCNIPF